MVNSGGALIMFLFSVFIFSAREDRNGVSEGKFFVSEIRERFSEGMVCLGGSRCGEDWDRYIEKLLLSQCHLQTKESCIQCRSNH